MLAAAIVVVLTTSSSGMGWGARWLVGGILLLASAEMTTASHYFLTAFVGVSAPALMQSPHLSASLSEFWAECWNPALSALVFGKLFFKPLARHGVGLALFAAFLAARSSTCYFFSSPKQTLNQLPVRGIDEKHSRTKYYDQ